MLIVISLVYSIFRKCNKFFDSMFCFFLFSFCNYSVAYINLIGISADPRIKSLLKFLRTVIYLV